MASVLNEGRQDDGEARVDEAGSQKLSAECRMLKAILAVARTPLTSSQFQIKTPSTFSLKGHETSLTFSQF